MLSEALKAAIKKEESRRPQKIETRGGELWLGGALLSKDTDDLTTAEWVQVFRHMENEPAVASSDFIIRAMTLECGWSIGTAVEEPTDRSKKPGAVQARRDYAKAEEVRIFVEGMCQRLETSLDWVFWHAMSAWGNGHKLFEVVRDFVTQDDGSSGVETVAIKPKPRSAYCFAVTRNMDLIGAVPEKGGLLLIDREGKLADHEKFVPAEDLFVLTLGGEDGDPRGKPAKRAAYDAWYRKQLTKPESMTHAQLFGMGRYSVEAPLPSAADVPLPATTVTVGGVETDVNTYLSGQMQYLANAGWIVLPPGYTLKDHQPTQGGGQVFEQIFDRCDREMVTALLGVTRATMEAEFGSKADSGTAEGLLARIINWLRKQLCDAFRKQVFEPAVRLRFGSDIAKKFTPKLLMHVVKEEDIAALLTAVSTAYANGVVTDEQLPYWDRRLGQPERDVADTKDDGTDPKAKGPEFRKTRKAIPKQADYSALIREKRSEITALCKRLQSGLAPEDWADEFYQLLVDGHTEAWVLGRQRGGDLRVRGSDDEERGATAADLEAEFLQDFVAKLSDPSIPLANGGLYGEDGALKLSKVTNRAKSYTGKMRASAHEAFVESGGDDEEYDWVLGAVEEHCSECPLWEANGPYTKATLSIYPGGGSTPCLYNCECYLKRRSDGRICYRPV